MKKITRVQRASLFRVLLPLLALVALGACEDTNCIKGEGPMEPRTLHLQPIREVEVNGDFIVYLTQGETQQVEVKGEPNILDELETQVTDGKWKLTYRSCIRRSKVVEVHLTLPQVNALYLNGSGRIYSQNELMVTELPVTVNGSGKVELNLNATKVMTQVTGSGRVQLLGKAQVHAISVSGDGEVAAFDLEAEDVTVNLSGNATAEVTAKHSLTADVSGAGTVYYAGNPPTVHQHVSGGGRVMQR